MQFSCTLQIYLSHHWQDAAQITVANPLGGATTSLVVGYDLAYALDHLERADAAALSSNQPVTLEPTRHSQWPAYLVDHLPQGFGRLELLRQLGLPERAEVSADWPLLLHGAGNPIGHLRVKEAHQYITERTAQQAQSQTTGFSWEEVAARGEGFTEYLASHGLFVAGSSGVQGEWPKILLTEDEHGRLHLDHDLNDARARRHWLVKFARATDSALEKILRLEATWIVLAKHLGLRTEGQDHLQGRALFVERFDRTVTASAKESTEQTKVERHPQESLYSMCGIGGFAGKLSHNQAVETLARVATDPASEVLEYLRRDIANVVLGNKDNHGRNTAFTRRADGVALTPVFDFCPMYLHPDGIARRMRWEDASGRQDGGQPDWQVALAVCVAALSAGNASVDMRHHLLTGLQDTAARLATLLPKMTALNVDADVIAFLRPIIETNRRLLDELR